MNRIGEVVVTDRSFVADIFIAAETREEVARKIENTEILEEVNEIERLPFLTALQQIVTSIERGHYIAAIKRLRELTGTSLIDAKGIIDRMRNFKTDINNPLGIGE